MRTHLPTVFISSDSKYVCDTCIPLKKAIKEGEVDWIGFKRGLYPGKDLKGNELDGLRLLAYWDAKKNQNWGLPYHRNEGMEIGFVENGSVEFSSDAASKKYDVVTPEFVTVTKPWQEHSIGNPLLGTNKMHFAIIDFGVRRPNQKWVWPDWIILSRKDRDEFARLMQTTSNTIFKSTPEINSSFIKIGKILAEDSPDFSRLALLLNIVFIELLNVFKDGGYTESSPNENVVKCFLSQLPTYCGEEWTLESMAADCGLKPTRFSYYCKTLTNLTPMEILNSVRLERARKMIEDRYNEKNIVEIALECGFSSSQYFSTKFREKFGCPPTAIKSADILEE